MVHIVPNPVVRDKQIHIAAAEQLAGMVDRSQIIFGGVLRVIEEFDLIFVDQIFKLFL